MTHLEIPTMRSTRNFAALALALAVFAGCGESSFITTHELLLNDEPFVEMVRDDPAAAQTAAELEAKLQGLGATDPFGGAKLVNAGQSFYIALSKKELGKRWFLSAYLKQYYPGAVAGGSARSLGTRVVSFKVQNDKLFVFDADNRRKSSDTFSPQLLVEAYPVVKNFEPFNKQKNSENYVLFDPAAGLNRFGVVSDAFGAGAVKFQTELTYSQRYRKLTDGITFEQVFTGYADYPDNYAPGQGEDNLFRSSGTLSIGLRRYAEGPGYKPTPLPSKEHYFRSEVAIVPNSGQTVQVAAKWNIKRGMTPIKWLVAPQVQAMASDPRFKDVDLYGAIKAGIENWNDAFGFRALEAQLAAKGDSFADDDKNYLIFDQDPSFGAAFANWRLNPNTGEIRGASVYFSSMWLEVADYLFPAPNAAGRPLPAGGSVARMKTLNWDAIPHEPLCQLWARPMRPLAQELAQAGAHRSAQSTLSRKELIERYVTHVIAHEIGHTLGLRHNFRGSTVPPTTSVMEYVDDVDAVQSTRPGAYDVSAVRFLYGLASQPPSEPFCTDEHTRLDPDCNRFDFGTDPLRDYYGAYYRMLANAFLTGQSPRAPNVVLNGVLQYVRVPSLRPTDTQLPAWNIAVAGVRAPLPADRAANAAYAARADALLTRVISRLFLDPPPLRGGFMLDPMMTPALHTEVVGQLKAVLTNSDKVRSFGSRRVMVDVLKKLQHVEAYRALSEARTAVDQQRATLTGDAALQTQDLLSRIDRALNPYFN